MDQNESTTHLAADVGRLLKERGAMLVTAESCTGGLLGHRLTEVAGSSDYYKGGIVSYSNELKEVLLGVRRTTLLEQGAVSADVAREMADGARERLAGDYALSITGIAGPGGGTAEKPVGLTFVALATPEGTHVHRYVWQGDRSHNKLASARAALELLCEHLTVER